MLVEFIISAYNRWDNLDCLLRSLICQTDKEWQAHVVIDNPGTIIPFIDDSRIRYTLLPVRYNDFGHTPRNIGKDQSSADYVILTNDDNYYTPNLVAELRTCVENRIKIQGEKPGMVYWDMVHSHFNYQFFKCIPATGQIDMGAFATRTDLAKQIHLNSTFAADGDFVEDFKKKFPLEQKVKINKVLFVHN